MVNYKKMILEEREQHYQKKNTNLSQQTIIERMIQILSLSTNFNALILTDNIQTLKTVLPSFSASSLDKSFCECNETPTQFSWKISKSVLSPSKSTLNNSINHLQSMRKKKNLFFSLANPLSPSYEDSKGARTHHFGQ